VINSFLLAIILDMYIYSSFGTNDFYLRMLMKARILEIHSNSSSFLDFHIKNYQIQQQQRYVNNSQRKFVRNVKSPEVNLLRSTDH